MPGEPLAALVEPLAAFADALPADAALWPAVRARLHTWCTRFDRAAPVQRKSLRADAAAVAGMDGLSPTHVAGAQLCRLLHEADAAPFAEHDVERDVYAAAPALRVGEAQIRDMTWPELADLTTALQIALHDVVRLEAGADGPRVAADIDALEVLVHILRRAGFWTTRAWREAPGAAAPAPHLDTDAGGWVRVGPHAVVQLLDACHAMGSIMLALLDGEIVPGDEPGVAALLADMTEHHREVTLDRFYELSMLAAIHPGMIAQYKHRHQEVFHSISQVVYYNWPSYNRERQAAFPDIIAERRAPNLLPLVLEMLGTVPVLCEHTGALHAPTHAAHACAFVLVGRFYALVTRDLRVLLHTDALVLAARALELAARPGSV